jgi:hypothetical protein
MMYLVTVMTSHFLNFGFMTKEFRCKGKSLGVRTAFDQKADKGHHSSFLGLSSKLKVIVQHQTLGLLGGFRDLCVWTLNRGSSAADALSSTSSSASTTVRFTLTPPDYTDFRILLKTCSDLADNYWRELKISCSTCFDVKAFKG